MTIQNNINFLIENIKNNPLDKNLRLELLQFYCLDGQWNLALKVIKQYIKLNQNDSQTKVLFLNNIICEIERSNVFFDNHFAQAYPKTNHNLVIKQIELLNLFKLDKLKNMTDYFLNSFELVDNELSCTLKDNVVTGKWIDTDCRLAFVIEVFQQDKYYWLSINEVDKIIFKDTEILPDVFWRRAEIILKDKQHIACFLPVRYPFQSNDEMNDQLKYASSTLWNNVNELSIGLGQKTYTNGDDDISILDIIELQSI